MWLSFMSVESYFLDEMDIFPYSQKERLKYQKDYSEAVKKLEEQMVMVQRKNENSHPTSSGEVVIFI